MKKTKKRTAIPMPKGKLCGYVCKDCAQLNMDDKGARESHMCLHYKEYTLDEDSIGNTSQFTTKIKRPAKESQR